MGISFDVPQPLQWLSLLLAPEEKEAAEKFMAAVARHRHPERETDPPAV